MTCGWTDEWMEYIKRSKASRLYSRLSNSGIVIDEHSEKERIIGKEVEICLRNLRSQGNTQNFLKCPAFRDKRLNDFYII